MTISSASQRKKQTPHDADTVHAASSSGKLRREPAKTITAVEAGAQLVQRQRDAALANSGKKSASRNN